MKPQLIKSGQIFLICYQSMEFTESISRNLMTTNKLMRRAKAKEKYIVYSLLFSGQTQVCRQFSLSEIQSASSNFSDKYVIGRGGYGKVYKCSIEIGSVTADVAIKRLHLWSSQGAPEFWAEVEMLSKLRHCNLVSLIGYCNDEKEMILVYEYMQNGTLADQLIHRADNSLSWLQRLRICIEAARGLEYLHTGTGNRYGVIHRDVKTSNILLDENFSAKISDFGLAKISSINQTHSYVSTTVKGTFGYLDPSYFYTGKLTRKSDVYAFGVVLLEVLCGRPAVDATLEEEKWGLATWAHDCIRKGKVSRIVDCRLQGQISPNCLKEFSRIASGCLDDNPKRRPSMAEVVPSLVSLVSLQERMNVSSSNTTLMKKVRSLFWCKDYMKCNYSILADEAESDISEASNKAGDALFMSTPVTGDANNVKLKQKDSFDLIHVDASYSLTIVDLLHASAEYISRNSYSSLYKVLLDDGNQLVVKRIMKTFLVKEFDTEVSIVGKVRHKNITTLKACYTTRKEAILVCACSQNGTVASFLSNTEARRPTTVIDWPTRLKIIIGITRGLVYLHTTKHMTHGNLTSRNVLLDKNYNPFITDIGLSRLRINARPDSPYNHAPELLYFQNASMETDVYSLGLIMLELLTGKSVLKEEWTMEVFDADVMLEADIEEEFVRILHLALNCMCSSPVARLKSDEVLLPLEEIYDTRKRKDERKRRKEGQNKVMEEIKDSILASLAVSL